MPTFKIIKKNKKEDVITGKELKIEKNYYVIEDEVGDTLYSINKSFCECIVPVSM